MNDRWMNTGYEDNEKLRPAQDQPAQAFDQERIGQKFWFLSDECMDKNLKI